MITFRFWVAHNTYVTVLADNPKAAIARFRSYWDVDGEPMPEDVPAFRLEQVVPGQTEFSH